MNDVLPPSFQTLLIQVRNPDDPMKPQEVECFRSVLRCDVSQIKVFDLTTGSRFTVKELSTYDLVVIGGSGDHSVAERGPWWSAAADNMRTLYASGRPCFASCWGFQALAQALGGHVVTDLDRAEVGTIDVRTTQAAADDPVFGPGPSKLKVQSGHQDIVDSLPPDAICLASSDRVRNQAMTFRGKPIYGTQFHPELDRKALIQRIRNYPQYVEKITGQSLEEFIATCEETPESAELLRRFVALITS